MPTIVNEKIETLYEKHLFAHRDKDDAEADFGPKSLMGTDPDEQNPIERAMMASTSRVVDYPKTAKKPAKSN